MIDRKALFERIRKMESNGVIDDADEFVMGVADTWSSLQVIDGDVDSEEFLVELSDAADSADEWHYYESVRKEVDDEV